MSLPEDVLRCACIALHTSLGRSPRFSVDVDGSASAVRVPQADSSKALPDGATATMRTAIERIDVAADICAFASTYAAAGSRGAASLTPPSFCEALAEASDRREQSGFWGALWRPLKAIASSILGDDGRDEPRYLPPPSSVEIVEITPSESHGAPGAAPPLSPWYEAAPPRFGSTGVNMNVDEPLDEIDSPSAAGLLTSPMAAAPPAAVATPSSLNPHAPPWRSPLATAALGSPHNILAMASPPAACMANGAADSVAEAVAPACAVAPHGGPGLDSHVAAGELTHGALDVSSPGLDTQTQTQTQSESQAGAEEPPPPPPPPPIAVDDALKTTTAAPDTGDAAGRSRRRSMAGRRRSVLLGGGETQAGGADETEAILHSIDKIVAGLGGAGLTVAEAALLQEQVGASCMRAPSTPHDSSSPTQTHSDPLRPTHPYVSSPQTLPSYPQTLRPTHPQS